jgi:hypothetical protein
MKTISTYAIIFLFASQIQAQTLNYNPFKVDVTTGIGASKNAVGFGLAFEPKYNFSNDFSAGLRWETAQMYNSFDSGSGIVRTSGPDGWVNSFVFTGEFYYPFQSSFRPFFGGGTGLYLANFDVADGKNTSAKIGFLLRGGFQIGHLRLVAENNFIPDDIFNLNYYNLKIGATFGGGRIKR